MLASGVAIPAKRALVDQALSALYGGDLSALAAGWKITAATAADVYAASPTPPAQDVEALRQFFAMNYYRTLYQTVKSIDPNHLYFGFWIVPGWWVNSHDWEMMAANCDVIGFDYYVMWRPFGKSASRACRYKTTEMNIRRSSQACSPRG
jgi:hypothetical protein